MELNFHLWLDLQCIQTTLTGLQKKIIKKIIEHQESEKIQKELIPAKIQIKTINAEIIKGADILNKITLKI